MVKEAFDEHRLPREFAQNVIDGLEQARWGGGHKENSVVGALEAALRAIGEEIPYEFLMGVSGGAFRIQMHQPKWCPSAPHANCGLRLYDTLAAALPYEFVQLGAEQGNGARRAPEALIDSIDQGVPAFWSHEEESLVVGYDKQGQEVLLRPYAAQKEGYVPHSVDELLSGWGGFEVLRKKAERPERRESLIRSLEIALEFANTKVAPGGSPDPAGEYACGFAAYECWIEQLRDGIPREGQEMCGNAHSFYSLIDARAAAASYLEAIAPEFEGEAGERLSRAGELYHEIGKILTRRNPVELAPQPWFPAAKSWNQDLRNEQAELLEEAMGVERRALVEIEGALALLGRRPEA